MMFKAGGQWAGAHEERVRSAGARYALGCPNEVRETALPADAAAASTTLSADAAAPDFLAAFLATLNRPHSVSG